MTYTNLFSELVRTEIQLWDSLDAHLKSEVGLTVSQLQALAAIAALEGVARVQDISESMSITVGATSKLVDRLERDGLAARQSNPDDRRSSIVVLTSAGAISQAAAAAAAEEYWSSLLDGTGVRESELTRSLATLRTLVANGTTK